MDRRLAAPGPEGKLLARGAPETVEQVGVSTLRSDAAWEHYLHDPDPGRLGICCSGGGIRSGSYNLGALQILRRRGVLEAAEYFASVSGGGYSAIAHVVLVSETLQDDNAVPGWPPDFPPPAQPQREEAFFGALPPWAPGSPEEEHLRNHTNYLAPGFAGKVWFFLNLLYGMVRHLLPFAAGVFLLGALTGLGFHRWVGPDLRDRGDMDLGSLWYGGWAAVALSGLAFASLFARQFEQTGKRPRSAVLSFLQGSTLLLFGAAVAVALLLVGLPALLLWLEGRPFEILRDPGALAGIQVGGVSLLSILAYLARRGILKRFLPVLTSLLGPLFILGPFVGVAYWATQGGIDFTPDEQYSTWPAWGAGVSLVILIAYVFLNEVTPNMHWYYRERLATAFIGLRRASAVPVAGFEHGEPPWERAVSFSKIRRGETTAGARLPKLVVCGAVNLSEDVPPGRLAAPFTFEQDFCGGPLTGYIRTDRLEARAGEAVVTLPALMAISGAALAPSMGKMTRPWLRMLMAIFNVRLGVWLPNPHNDETRLGAFAVREARAASPAAAPPAPPPPSRFKRPGALYSLWEALGRNSLRRNFVYVSDGGHFDNLGLVEVLRRGCGQILCFDAAGDDLEHFHTLSEAIAVARADLGISIEIDLSPLRASKETGESETDHVVGKVTYPDGNLGILVFAKAAMTPRSPQDARAYRERDPKFPTHPTTDQLFNERKFESYRALGAHAAEGAVDALSEARVARGMSPFP